MEQTHGMTGEVVQLETERLLINPLRLTDAPAIFAARTNPKTNAFLPWKPNGLEEVKAFIEKAAQTPANTPESWCRLGIREKTSGQLLGDMGVHFLGPNNQQAEIGYMLFEAYQGRGYAKEAIQGLLAFLFRHYKKHRIVAFVDPLNTPSVQLLRRVGMRQEGHHLKSYWLEGKWVDELTFALLREEWEAKPPTPVLHEKA